jgi:hypothetical protein
LCEQLSEIALVGRLPRDASHEMLKPKDYAMPIDSPLGKGHLIQRRHLYLRRRFESAWETVKKSGSLLAEDRQALSTREILAKRIIDSAQTGERDPKRFINDALSHLTASS